MNTSSAASLALLALGLFASSVNAQECSDAINRETALQLDAIARHLGTKLSALEATVEALVSGSNTQLAPRAGKARPATRTGARRSFSAAAARPSSRRANCTSWWPASSTSPTRR